MRMSATLQRGTRSKQAASVMPEIVLHAEPSELEQISALRSEIDAMVKPPNKAYLLGSRGDQIELPPSAVEALRLIVEALAQGRSVTLVPSDKDLTSQEAA